MMAPATAIFVLAGLSQMAHASEQTGTLTLACKGTVISEAKREHISTSIVVNFTARTVQGFEYPGSIMITRTNEFTVDFGDSKDDMSITGIIDRVTGDVDATSPGTPAGPDTR
jgi:hypothetical protein